MKLNSPETAPKDRCILAHFGGSYLYVAAWDSWMKNWGRAEMKLSDMQSYTIVTHQKPEYLEGWLPMPTIDDEGTVQWTKLPSA